MIIPSSAIFNRGSWFSFMVVHGWYCFCSQYSLNGFSKHSLIIVVTARKRSCGNGNVFTPVCHSVPGGAGLHPFTESLPPRQTPALADLRGAPGMRPPWGVQILSFSCSFWEKNWKIIALLGVGAAPGENPRSATAPAATEVGGTHPTGMHTYLLPSATKLRRVCFYTCLSVHRGGGVPQCMLGYHPPPQPNQYFRSKYRSHSFKMSSFMTSAPKCNLLNNREE